MKQTKTSLIFSAAIAAFLTTGVAQAELSSNDIFSFLEETTYSNASLAGTEQHTPSSVDRVALDAIFALGDESIDVNSRPQVDMASMAVTGYRSDQAQVT